MSVENQPHRAALILVELERQKQITDVLSFLSLLGSLSLKLVLTRHFKIFKNLFLKSFTFIPGFLSEGCKKNSVSVLMCLVTITLSLTSSSLKAY